MAANESISQIKTKIGRLINTTTRLVLAGKESFPNINKSSQYMESFELAIEMSKKNVKSVIDSYSKLLGALNEIET